MKIVTIHWRWQIAIVIALVLFGYSEIARAGAWQGIEPFKSRREDVLKILGPPVTEGHNGLMTFKVAGGTASISFVDQNFVRTKKLRPEFAGTVLQVILQHESSSDTPESMNLSKQKDFVKDSSRDAVIYRNLKDGIVYTFINGRLRTTRYTFSESQIGRARH